jgi:3-oxoacyl-[acyl-carrier protein] reductase
VDLLSDGREDGWGVRRLPTEIVDVPVWKLLDLSGRTAIVTGGGGGGLGQACAKRLAAQGANIAIVDRDRSGAERVALDVAQAYDVKTVGIEANLDDYSAAVRAVGMCEEQLGPVEILVNNVGGASQSVPFHDEEVPRSTPRSTRTSGRCCT